MLMYDPYTGEQKQILFPRISNNDTFHVSGIDFDPRTDAVYASANAALPFLVSDLDPRWPNFLVKYDIYAESIAYVAGMAAATAEISAAAGQSLNGYQDMAEYTKGNSYFIMTHGSALVKVSLKVEASMFFHQPKLEITNPPGLDYGGLVVSGQVMEVKYRSGEILY